MNGIRRGTIVSCGCAHYEWMHSHFLTHGHAVGRNVSRTYAAWQDAKRRCFNPRCSNYSRYGGRGITVSAVWSDDFAAFLADMGECPPGLSLDRIDFNGNYEPGNCRWVTLAEQSRNTSRNAFVTVEGRRMCLAEAARVLSFSADTAYTRCRSTGMDYQQYIDSPARRMNYAEFRAWRKHLS